MGATNTFAPFGIFCEGGAFFSPASAVETAATTSSTRMLTTFRLYDIGHSFRRRQSARLLNHNLLNMFGACLSCALPAAQRVGLVDGVAEDDCSGLEVRNFDAGLFIRILRTDEQHLCPTCLLAIRDTTDFVVGLAAVSHYGQRHFLVPQAGNDVILEAACNRGDIDFGVRTDR